MILVILILSISLVSAIKTFRVDETELVSLMPTAVDEDEDQLSYSFTSPLDEHGQWQTTYGDMGEYEVKVTVSDGESNTSEDVLLVVNKKNVAPTIDSFLPEEPDLDIDEGEEIYFIVTASDLNRDSLEYIWEFDNNVISEKEEYIYNADYWDEGVHNVKVVVLDGEKEDSKEWTVKVNDVDRAALLDGIKNVVVNEEETVQFILPDFEKYNLEYAISEPIGNDNVWETNYDDSGVYYVEITLEDRRFSASTMIQVEVVNVDRPAVFEPLAAVWMKENQKAAIEIKAMDPDGDDIEFVGENLPEGATLVGNQFEWVTNYDTIKKDNIVEFVLDKFHLLYKPFKVTFVAKSGNFEVREDVWIMVRDSNRAPTLNDISIITVNEGEEVVIGPEANDPDGDKLVYFYSGWMNAATYETDYDDAGTYRVRVRASDGFLSDEKYVTVIVEDVNRGPLLEDIFPITVNEGEEVVIELEANDPDGDLVLIAVGNMSIDYEFENNIFSWVTDHDTVFGDSEVFTVIFMASDAYSEAINQVNITVNNVNRMPEIISATPLETATVSAGEKVRFELNVEDLDGDELSYKWKFGLFEEYVGDKGIVRTFTNKGTKKIEVVVSDGLEEISYRWDLRVV